MCSFENKLRATAAHHNNPTKTVFKKWELENNYEQLCDLVAFLDQELLPISDQYQSERLLDAYVLMLTYMTEQIGE